MTLQDRVLDLIARRNASDSPAATHVAMGVEERVEMHENRGIGNEPNLPTYCGLEIIKVNVESCLIVGTAMLE